jgi:hypothetical protein
MVSQGKNMLIVESLVDNKRIPSYSKDKVVSLGDIAIYTDKKEISLSQVLESIKVKENGGACPVDSKADNNVLRKYMESILPDYDKERVYPSDMRKIFNWYNILLKAEITNFVEQNPEEKAEITE